MKTMLCGLVVTAMLIIVGTPVLWAGEAAAAAGDSYEVVQIWTCEMKGETTEEQVESIAKDWLKAIRQMPGGSAAKVRVFFPRGRRRARPTSIVLNAPFTDWERCVMPTEDSAAAKSDELNQQGRVASAHAVPQRQTMQ